MVVGFGRIRELTGTATHEGVEGEGLAAVVDVGADDAADAHTDRKQEQHCRDAEEEAEGLALEKVPGFDGARRHWTRRRLGRTQSKP